MTLQSSYKDRNARFATVTLKVLSDLQYDSNINVYNLQIYKIALSASQITQNYNATKSRFLTSENILTNGLIFSIDASKITSYPGTGTSIYDLSGLSNNGTLVSQFINTDSFLRKAVVVFCASIILAISAHLYIPTLPVPFTLQSFAVIVIGATLGRKMGTAAVLLYITQGLAEASLSCTKTGLAPSGSLIHGRVMPCMSTLVSQSVNSAAPLTSGRSRTCMPCLGSAA